MKVRFYQYSNHGFTRCKLAVYRQQAHLRSFISVVVAMEKQFILYWGFILTHQREALICHSGLTLYWKSSTCRCAEPFHFHADFLNCAALITVVMMLKLTDAIWLYFICLNKKLLHRCCVNHRTCLSIMHETEKYRFFFYYYYFFMFYSACLHLCICSSS